MAEGGAIDFARSSVTWLLPEQPSYGRFAIDASLVLPNGETYYLCAQVYAGDVYGEGPLFKDPPYEFSAAFSEKRYRIFRDAVRGPAQEDSRGAPGERFKSLRLDIARMPCRIVGQDEITNPPPYPLSMRVHAAGCELEFPVRHLNWREDGRWQVETGPLLVAEDGEGDVPARLRRAYVIVSCAERAEFLVDAVRAGARWSRRVALSCKTEFLAAG